jgi:hypothetical protein
MRVNSALVNAYGGAAAPSSARHNANVSCHAK